jgi:hypothetical protein
LQTAESAREEIRLDVINRARSPISAHRYKGRHQTHAKLKSLLTFASFAALW